MSYIVSLEIKRVQTYLFGIPELKCMVGANTILGEVVRGRLHEDEACLAGLAIRHGAALPVSVKADKLRASAAADPIHGTASPDDPRQAWQRGILARDGGHFITVFPELDKGLAFVADAQGLMAEKLPGLGYKVAIRKLEQMNGKWEEGREDLYPSLCTSLGAIPTGFPQLQTCEVAGNVFASRVDDSYRVSLDVDNRRDAARRFNANETHDVLGLIKGRMKSIDFPADFKLIARSGYLAVIVADGNGMGAGVPARSEFPDYFERQRQIEHYFYQYRYQMRLAVKETLEEFVRGGQVRETSVRPMMLGGDDLVVACDAPMAFEFIQKLCRRVESKDREPGKKFTLGAGIAIVKASFPFHRAHALAEQLAASAKVRWRAEKGSGGNQPPPSMVDWLVTSEAWHDDLESTRVRDAVREIGVGGAIERLVLSRRPYPVRSSNPKAIAESGSLEGLLEIRKGLVAGEKSKVARSQVMYLADTLPLGKRQGNHAVRDLPEVVQSALAPLLVDHSPWDARGTTGVLDLLDLHEVIALGEGKGDRR